MYSNKMFIHKEYSSKTSLQLDQLKSDIDRKISKISWMIKQKYKHDKQRFGSIPITVKHIGVQTIGQYHLNNVKDAPLMIDKHMQNSNHTKVCSSIGISTSDCTSLNKINFVSQTQNSSDGSFENLETNQNREDDLYNFRQIVEGHQDYKGIEETRNLQINNEPFTQQQTNFSIKEQPEDIVEDSLDIQFDRNHQIQQKQNEKFFTEQNMKQSLLMSVSSAQQQENKQYYQQINQPQTKIIIQNKQRKQIQREDKLPVSKVPNKRKMPKKQPVPKFSGRRQSPKKQMVKTEELNKKRENIKEKIDNKNKTKTTKNKTEKIKTQGNIIDDELIIGSENSFISEHNGNKGQSMNLKPKKTSFKQISNFNKTSKIVRKNIVQKTPNKGHTEKIIVSPEVKQKMKFLIGQLTPRDRREDNDSTIRANLLKRIEERNKTVKQ